MRINVAGSPPFGWYWSFVRFLVMEKDGGAPASCIFGVFPSVLTFNALVEIHGRGVMFASWGRAAGAVRGKMWFRLLLADLSRILADGRSIFGERVAAQPVYIQRSSACLPLSLRVKERRAVRVESENPFPILAKEILPIVL